MSNPNDGAVRSKSKKEKRTKFPKLHALSTLPATATKKWKYSPAEVLKLVQGLYNKIVITYPRTDTLPFTQ
ncbi:DNA topoisomerase [Sporosarcina sp. BP05]|uniref:DNA topoisomerase n=1 Tax=Sporosarcina sp. BP05 TaxID=2758726 RepID=UPI00351C57AB